MAAHQRTLAASRDTPDTLQPLPIRSTSSTKTCYNGEDHSILRILTLARPRKRCDEDCRIGEVYGTRRECMKIIWQIDAEEHRSWAGQIRQIKQSPLTIDAPCS